MTRIESGEKRGAFGISATPCPARFALSIGNVGPGDGAAGRRATTHWASLHLCPISGAIPVNERVVVDGAWIFAAGVTAGIDGALRLAAELRGDEVAQAIPLHLAYAPEPPFDSGAAETAASAILEQARRSLQTITGQREQTARRVAAKLGIAVPAAGGE